MQSFVLDATAPSPIALLARIFFCLFHPRSLHSNQMRNKSLARGSRQEVYYLSSLLCTSLKVSLSQGKKKI